MVKKFERVEEAWLPASICLLPLPVSTISIRSTIQPCIKSIIQEEELKVKCYGATFRAKRTFALGRASIVRCGLNSVTAPSSTSGISLRTAQARARLPFKMSVMTREFLTTNELAATLGIGRELPRC